jgi:hypothetical protein
MLIRACTAIRTCAAIRMPRQSEPARQSGTGTAIRTRTLVINDLLETVAETKNDKF